MIPAEGTPACHAADGSRARDTPGGNAPRRDLAGREPPARDLPGRDLAGREPPARDLPGRDLAGRAPPGHDLADREPPGHDLADREAPARDPADRGTQGRDAPGRDFQGRDTTGRDLAGLLFVAEMYGVQLDHLAAALGVGEPRARAIAAQWRSRRYAESARLGPGRPWTWLTRTGLAACGLPYMPTQPALARLAHIRAVVAVRLALEAAPRYAAAGGYWRGERRLRARMGGRVGLREHVPDAEVHWPDDAPVPWAGECWAIEAELTRKTVSRTAAIMRDLLTRTGDYGCPAAEVRVPGRPPRHARVIYLCAPAAQATVARARDMLGSAGVRIEIRSLPPDAAMAPPRPRASPAQPQAPPARPQASPAQPRPQAPPARPQRYPAQPQAPPARPQAPS